MEKNVILIQSYNYPVFAVSSRPALRLLRGCCSVAAGGRCCDGICRVLRTAEHGGGGGPFKHMMDVTGVEICWAFLSAIKESLETFKLKDYQSNQSQVTIQTEQLDLQKAFKQEKADDSNAVHNSKCRLNNDVGRFSR